MSPDPKWEFIEYDEEKIKTLEKDLGIKRLLAVLLYTRGYHTVQEAKKFIFPDIITDLENPFLFDGMEKSVQRVKRAISKKEKIIIFGDRDVDGITATAILYKALKHFSANVEYALPKGDRKYGLSEEWIDEFASHDGRLLITVDNGISSVTEIERAKEKGMDVIIMDHHTPSPPLPQALAILNPKVPEERYPFKSLSGVGVVYKFISALFLSFHRFYMKNIVIIDIETTGLDEDDQIMEICGIKLRNNIEIDRFHSYIKPLKKVPPFIQKMTGISKTNLSKAPDAKQVIPEFYEFIKDAILVGHNLEDFDYKYLARDIKKYCRKNLNNQLVDTLKISRRQFPDISHKLQNLAEYMGIEIDNSSSFHSAEYDAFITRQVFARFVVMGFNKMRKILLSFSELTALGTLADIVPLIGENRILVKKGIEQIKKTKIVGLKVLFEKLNIVPSDINSKITSWNIIPVLNSAGRMGMADYSLRLLLTEDIKEAQAVADDLVKLNIERKNRFAENFEKVIKILPEKVDIIKDKIFIVDIEDLEHGVTGIVANRLKDIYYRPTVVLIVKEGTGMGSARSIKSFMIKKAFDQCNEFLEAMGGHPFAVGFSIKKENIPVLKNRLRQIANQEITDEDLIPVISIDTVLLPEDLCVGSIAEIINIFEPYGEDNEEPVFLLKEFEVKEVKYVGDEGAHLFLKISKNRGLWFSAIWWRKGNGKGSDLRVNDKVDIVCKLELDEWRQKKYIKLVIEDLKVLSTQRVLNVP
ncbi:MAG: single-stranded-DNA-specific exonuclease RecJ [Spirochaetes bacterium]|nr:single-stranded-DNA-specific exonuclease RecJ [Spirochaetota bacterium]